MTDRNGGRRSLDTEPTPDDDGPATLPEPCYMCGAPVEEMTWLGDLGGKSWYRCRHCGAECAPC